MSGEGSGDDDHANRSRLLVLLRKWNASPATITPTIFKQFLRRDSSTLEYGKVDARDRMTASNVNPSGFPKMQMRDSARYRIRRFRFPP